jgi:hypothetical protein
MAYLTEEQIDEMVDAAVTTFEATANRRAAVRAAAEYAIDEFGIKPRKSVVLIAVRRAGLLYMLVDDLYDL